MMCSTCKITPSILLVLPFFAVLGLLLVILAHKCVRFVYFVTAFISVLIITFCASVSLQLCDYSAHLYVPLISGLLGGLIASFVEYIGLFVVGLHLGGLSSYFALLWPKLIDNYLKLKRNEPTSLPAALEPNFVVELIAALFVAFALLPKHKGEDYPSQQLVAYVSSLQR